MTPNEEIVSGGSEGAYIEPSETSSESSAVEQVAEREASESEGSEETSETTETPAYQANFKLKIMDQEKEIPEKFRELIKDAESEKEVREIFEKAYGLDFAKPKHEALQQTFTQLQSEHNYMLGHIEEAKAAYQRNDMDSFFEKLAIPQQKVLQYALEKLNYQELPAEQKALIDGRRTAERQTYDLQRQQRSQQTQYHQQVQQAHDMLMTSELARTDVKSAQESFDQRMGKPGAFMQAVQDRGRLSWFQSQGKNVLTPGQAIEQVLTMYNLKGAPESAAAQVTLPASGGNQGKNNTIPNVGGGKSTSPVKSKPRSIEDLKKLHKEMVAREA